MPIHVIVYEPQTEEGKRELAERISAAHADFVIRYIQKLNCPETQKRQLLDAIIESASGSCQKNLL